MSGVAVCCGIALVAGDAEETANSCASWVQNDCCEHESSHPALDAEEMPFSSASRQQNMHFDLKSVLDTEDMSVSSASWPVRNDQASQQ